MALGNVPTHATVLITFAPDLLNSLQNEKGASTVHQQQTLVSFDNCWFSEALRTVHFSLKCQE